MMRARERQGESGSSDVRLASFPHAVTRQRQASTAFGTLSNRRTISMKSALIILGVLSALLIVAQMVMGLLIRSGQVSLRTIHFHSGSLMVVVALAYIALSLSAILSRPQPK